MEEVFSKMIQQNSSIVELVLESKYTRWSPETCRALFRGLKHNFTITTCQLPLGMEASTFLILSYFVTL